MRHALSALLVILALAPAATFAADSSATAASPAVTRAAAAAEPAASPATLRFFNREIVTFRVRYFGYTPAERASAANQRIREALAKGGPGAVKMTKSAEGLAVAIDGAYVFRILEGDLDADDGQTFDQARVVVTGRLEEADRGSPPGKDGARRCCGAWGSAPPRRSSSSWPCGSSGAYGSGSGGGSTRSSRGACTSGWKSGRASCA